MQTYQFHKRADGSYRCESRVPGEGACLVRKAGDIWETAQVPASHDLPRFSSCPVADAACTREGAVRAFFFYFADQKGR